METSVGRGTGQRPGWVVWAILTIGILGVSVSAILVRYASIDSDGEAHPLSISFWRCALGALALFRSLDGRGEERPHPPSSSPP